MGRVCAGQLNNTLRSRAPPQCPCHRIYTIAVAQVEIGWKFRVKLEGAAADSSAVSSGSRQPRGALRRSREYPPTRLQASSHLLEIQDAGIVFLFLSIGSSRSLPFSLGRFIKTQEFFYPPAYFSLQSILDVLKEVIKKGIKKTEDSERKNVEKTGWLELRISASIPRVGNPGHFKDCQ